MPIVPPAASRFELAHEFADAFGRILAEHARRDQRRGIAWDPRALNEVEGMCAFGRAFRSADVGRNAADCVTSSDATSMVLTMREAHERTGIPERTIGADAASAVGDARRVAHSPFR
jgi:hypothetical protein